MRSEDSVLNEDQQGYNHAGCLESGLPIWTISMLLWRNKKDTLSSVMYQNFLITVVVHKYHILGTIIIRIESGIKAFLKRGK